MAASRPLSVALMATLIFYVAIVLIFSLRVPPAVVERIADGLPYRLVYGLLAGNLVACLLQFVHVLRTRCAPYSLASEPEDQQPWIVLPVQAGGRLPALARQLRQRGNSVHQTSDGGFHAARGRWSALGTPCFHLALLLIASGVLLQHWFGFSAVAIVNEGESFFGEAREYVGLDADGVSHAPELSFRVRSVVPRFFENYLYFTDLVAVVDAPVGPGGRSQEVRLANGATIGEARVALVGFGYAVAFAIREGNGATVDTVVRLNIFPPGTADSFRLPATPYTVSVRLFPDYAVDPQGAPITRSVELRNPRLALAVRRNRVLVTQGIIKLGETLAFAASTLTPLRLIPQGQFRVQRSPGAPLFALGLWGVVTGLAWRLLRPRRELLLTIRPSGEVAVFFAGTSTAQRHALIDRLGVPWQPPSVQT